MKKILSIILCLLMVATVFVACNSDSDSSKKKKKAPETLTEEYLKGEWMAEFGMEEMYEEAEDELGIDLSKVKSKMKLTLEFDGEGGVMITYDTKATQKYFDELLDLTDDEDVKAEIEEMRDELIEDPSHEGEYEMLEDNLVDVADLEMTYEDGTLTSEEMPVIFVKQ